MFRTNIAVVALLLILTSTASYAQDAQDTLANNQDTIADKFPKALLVQLRSEHNRMAALIKQGKFKDLEILKKDALNVASRMIADFQDNFTYCPVYYYMDTNLDLIKSRTFSGVLFNADGTPATNIVISDTSKDYLIAFYGYPTSQARVTNAVKDTTYREVPKDPANNLSKAETIMDTLPYTYNSGEPVGQGLVINNYKFKQVSFQYKFGYENFLFKLKRANKKYIYTSKHFDMEYFPFAAGFNQQLLTRRKKIRITNYAGEVDY